MLVAAIGSLHLTPSGDIVIVEVWVGVDDTGKMRRKDLDAADRRGVALHAVELLHAVLFDVGLTPPSPAPTLNGFDNPYAEQSPTRRDPLAAIDALPDAATLFAKADAR